MDKQEKFLRHSARARIINNKVKKIARLVDNPVAIDALVEVCVKHWSEGNTAEEALRYMEEEAKPWCNKLGETRF